MSNKQTPNSRSNRFEKRRRGTKLMTWLAGLAGLLIIVFIGAMIFGGDDQASKAKQSEVASTTDDSKNNTDKSEADSSENQSENEEKTSDPETEQVELDDQDDKNTKKDEKNKENEEEGEVITEESSEANVELIIKKEWKPVATEQQLSGQHTVQYDKESQDWAEMEQAARNATGLSKSGMITWYIGHGDEPQQPLVTVSNKQETEIYRVHLKWVEGEGYQPTQVKVLKENDHK